MSERWIAWFSCGAPSAVAAKLAVEAYGDRCEVAYCDTMATEHSDNARFFLDVMHWIGRDIVRLHSTRYRDIDDVFDRTRYMAGISGARCTTEMKKLPRELFQQPGDIHIFGYTLGEERRAEEFEKHNPTLFVEWLLIDRGISKTACLHMLSRAGIKLPELYSLGFNHNNCLGCVKATSPAYWNRIRILFPEVFARRADQSRRLGVRLARYKGVRVYLDQLPADDTTDYHEEIECGPVCQTPAINPRSRRKSKE